jgi:hypothetical protein
MIASDTATIEWRKAGFGTKTALGLEALLTIAVIDGQGAINNIRQHAGRDMVVRVDNNQQPVAGASVVFTLPSQGASGSFVNGEKTLVVTANLPWHPALL